MLFALCHRNNKTPRDPFLDVLELSFQPTLYSNSSLKQILLLLAFFLMAPLAEESVNFISYDKQTCNIQEKLLKLDVVMQECILDR